MSLCSKPRFVSVIVPTVLASIVLGYFADPAEADDERKKQIVNGILRILIESQRDRRSEQEPPPPPPRQPNPRQPTRIPQSVATSQATLVKLTNESNGLVTLLSKNVEKSPSLRGHIPELLKFRARSFALAQSSQRVTHPSQLVTASRELDRDWRVLAYQLEQTPGLTGECTQCIQRMNAHGKLLCETLGYKPQVDHATLLSEANALTLRLQRVRDDIDLEYGRTVNGRNLLTETDRVNQHIAVFAASVRTADDYDSLVKNYRRFLGVWSPLESKLRSLRNRYLERSLERTDESDARIYELLWLPRGINRAQLGHLSNRIQHDVVALFDQITLTQIMQLSDPESVPASAAELLGVCQNLADCVQRGESADELVDAYNYIPPAWVGFSRLFRSARQPAMVQSLRQIQHSVVALREPLHLTEGLDLDACRKLSGSLELLAEHLGEDVEDWLNSREGRRLSFRVELARDVESFVNATRSLNQQLQGNRITDFEKSCEALANSWERTYASVAKCETDERDHLLNVSQRITAALVELEAMLLF